EIFRRHLIEKVAELRDLVVETLLIDLLALELDRGLLDHTIGGEDRSLGANRKGDRVRRPRVDLDLATVLLQGDLGVEGVLAELGDGDAHDLRAELLEHVAQQVVRHRARGRLALELHEDRRRFRMTDPDRKELVALGGLQQDDRLLADQVEADAVDVHFLHPRPRTEYSSAPEAENPVTGGEGRAFSMRWRPTGSRTSKRSRRSPRTPTRGG